ncbi:hypothetical protein ACRRTK_008629 [Alexandromys fortis]
MGCSLSPPPDGIDASDPAGVGGCKTVYLLDRRRKLSELRKRALQASESAGYAGVLRFCGSDNCHFI